MTALCLCGLPALYSDCCGRYHSNAAGSLQAPTAEALMRSRYSAYVRQLGDYVLASWHASTRPASIEFDDATKWLGLSVKHGAAKQAAADLSAAASLNLQKNPDNATSGDASFATVEFVARYKIAGRAFRLHETSRFVREGGQWFYLDGDIHS